MSDIAPNERPTDEQMRRNVAMDAARWDARDLLLRREPMEIFDAGFEAGLAAAHPVPEDVWLEAVAKLKTHAKGYVEPGDRAAWGDGWDACLRAIRYLRRGVDA